MLDQNRKKENLHLPQLPQPNFNLKREIEIFLKKNKTQ